jgi:hypothetical protein
MAEQAQKNQQQPQQPKQGPAPAQKKQQITLDQILAGLSNLPLLLDEDNEEITLSTKSFALMFVGVLEIDDANLLRALLRRRRVSARFEDALEVNE